MQDRAIMSLECQKEIICDLPNRAISSDLVTPNLDFRVLDIFYRQITQDGAR